MITDEPNEFVREIHTPMPVILKEKHHPADRMKAWPISSRVNTPKK
jgi:putative SOS response-associated peptidase YedK